MHDRHHPAGKLPRFSSPPTASATPDVIGEQVRAARFAAHLTQRELAGTTYSKGYISAVEHGKMMPSFQALAFLAERLGVTLSYLLGEEPNEQVTGAPEAPAEDSERVARLREAEQVLQAGRYEEAIARFEQVGQPERTNRAREQYAQFLAAQGRYQDAYEQMRLALQGQRDPLTLTHLMR